MSLFDRFRKQDPAPKETIPTGTVLQRPHATDSTPGKQPPESVRVYDEFGRELFVPIDAWRNTMLQPALAKAGDDPDKLYGLILDALQMHLAPDLLKAAERLLEIDPTPLRATTIYGIVLMQSGNPAAAVDVFEKYLAQHGPEGVVLTNLAKAQSAQGRQAASDATLWRAIEADPNQDNGLGWYLAIERDRGGEQGYTAALERVAGLPGSWRAQTWLARLTLDRNDLAQALELYKRALATAGTPAPADLLQSVSGELGKHGHLAEAYALTRPLYDPNVHGLPVGNNLVKIAIETGRFADAKNLLGDLQALKRPDWAENLNYWEATLHKQELAAQAPLAQAKVELFDIEGPPMAAAGGRLARAVSAIERGEARFLWFYRGAVGRRRGSANLLQRRAAGCGRPAEPHAAAVLRRARLLPLQRANIGAGAVGHGRRICADARRLGHRLGRPRRHAGRCGRRGRHACGA